MPNLKKYDFEIIFDKMKETKEIYECLNNSDLDAFEEVNREIKVLEEFTDFFKTPEYQTYTRS